MFDSNKMWENEEIFPILKCFWHDTFLSLRRSVGDVSIPLDFSLFVDRDISI